MSIFNHSDYRDFIRSHIKQLGKEGRGLLRQIAEHLAINSTWLSQILSGTQNLNIDQGYELAQFFKFTDLETEYLIQLIQLERAANHKTKNFLKKKLLHLKNEGLSLSSRMTIQNQLSEGDRAIFYSSWYYSALRLHCSLSSEGFTESQLQQQFELPRERLTHMLRFLVKTGLCIEENGKYKMGIGITHLEQGSPHLLKHHSNWRIKALQKSENLSAQELMITAPFSISKKDFESLREELIQFIKHFSKKVSDSEAEVLANLNIDLFFIE